MQQLPFLDNSQRKVAEKAIEEPARRMGGTRRVASDHPPGLSGLKYSDFRVAYALVRAESTPLASEPMLFPSAR